MFTGKSRTNSPSATGFNLRHRTNRSVSPTATLRLSSQSGQMDRFPRASTMAAKLSSTPQFTGTSTTVTLSPVIAHRGSRPSGYSSTPIQECIPICSVHDSDMSLSPVPATRRQSSPTMQTGSATDWELRSAKLPLSNRPSRYPWAQVSGWADPVPRIRQTVPDEFPQHSCENSDGINANFYMNNLLLMRDFAL